ncbi:DnaJ domain containing protein [Novymonas esmeraldas]|uniref:DnaJ domain containing protein n=1 Tax=Novymonas esmeraldas TaxID=1808958 RepID=A0AAW0ER50_9TRYP
MLGMRRVFVVKAKADTGTRLVTPPDEEAAAHADLAGEWLDCCLREYLERKRIFDNRFRTRAQLILRIAALLVLFLAALWGVWPMWRVLVDVETDVYYKALEVPSTATPAEVTRAYRSMVKRWHPDHNPTCGQLCRDKMERIKEAYDMLLARGDHSQTLANQYHESLMTLRSLLSFRGFQISGNAAMNVYMMLLRLYPASARNTVALRLSCTVSILVFCTVHETLYVSGFSLQTVIQLFFFVYSMAKTSAQEQVMEEVRRNSYFDVVRDGVVLLSSAGVATGVLWWRERVAVSMEEAFRLLYGSIYVMSFLYTFSPNIYDNFMMRKCSLPLPYLDMATARFSWFRCATSELLFLVDDLFVFTCRIPSPHRVVVYTVHFVSLCQLLTLPWDAPITKGRASVKALPARASGESSPPAPAASDAARAAALTDANAATLSEPGHFVESYVTKEEQDVFADLDSENVAWADIVSVKYKALVTGLAKGHLQQRGQAADAIDMAPSADLQSVMIVAFSRGGAGAAAAGATAGTAAPPQRVDIVSQVRDPEMSRLLAIERGPKMMFPPRPNMPWNLDAAREEYRRRLGAAAPWTSAQLWRRRVPSTAAGTWTWLAVVVCAWLALAVAAALAAPSPHSVVLSSRGLDASLRPQLFARFIGALPPGHFTNALSGGLLTVARLPLLTLDWWEAGATLGFVR